MNDRCAKRNNNCSVQRNSRRTKGTTIVLFKGTTGVQKEQQLFHSKEQQVHKRNDSCSIQRNSRHAKGTKIVLFKGTVGVQKEKQVRKRNNNCSILNHLNL
jgi:hypothetical protein